MCDKLLKDLDKSICVRCQGKEMCFDCFDGYGICQDCLDGKCMEGIIKKNHNTLLYENIK